MSLHIYTNEVIDYVIAESEADANDLLAELYGYPPQQLSDSGLLITAQWPDDAPLTLAVQGGRSTKMPAAWISSEGRGFLGSTEVEP